MLLVQRNAAGANAGDFLHLVLARLVAAPHCLDKAVALFFQRLGDLVHGLADIGLVLPVFQRLLEHSLRDHVLQQVGHGVTQRRIVLVQGNGLLFAVKASSNHALSGLDILRADLDTNRNALHLVLRKLPSRRVVGVVQLDPDALGSQCLVQLVRLVQNAFLVLCDGDDHSLYGSHCRRQNQTAVIAVCHDDSADQTGGHAPAGLVRICQLVVLAGKLDAERLGKAVPKVVGCTSLERLAVVHQCLDGIGGDSAGELVALGLSALDHRHCQALFAKVSVYVQHTLGLLDRLFCGSVDGVSFLPQEFPGAQERTGGLFPAHYADPLVVQLRQVTIAVYDVLVVIAEQSL